IDGGTPPGRADGKRKIATDCAEETMDHADEFGVSPCDGTTAYGTIAYWSFRSAKTPQPNIRSPASDFRPCP
ncbi:MAG: hypothetical protein LBI86_02255, partial [Treponema sp.]|nr:hypothetical protein [Treponema sp.]